MDWRIRMNLYTTCSLASISSCEYRQLLAQLALQILSPGIELVGFGQHEAVLQAASYLGHSLDLVLRCGSDLWNLHWLVCGSFGTDTQLTFVIGTPGVDIAPR